MARFEPTTIINPRSGSIRDPESEHRPKKWRVFPAFYYGPVTLIKYYWVNIGKAEQGFRQRPTIIFANCQSDIHASLFCLLLKFFVIFVISAPLFFYQEMLITLQKFTDQEGKEKASIIH